MARAKEPIESWPEYAFPWGWVISALVASCLLGIVLGEYNASKYLWTKIVVFGALWLAYSLYQLARAARVERRLRKELPALLVEQAMAGSADIAYRDEAARPPP